MNTQFYCLLALFVCVCIAQNPPKISDNFSANVSLIEDRGTHRLRFQGTLYEDYANKRQRIDTHARFEHERAITFLRFYSTKVEYEIIEADRRCNHRALNETMVAPFDWVQSGANEQNECHRRGAVGSLWVKHSGEDEEALCVSKQNPNTDPFWMVHRRRGFGGFEIEFESFTPGAPNPSLFTIPSFCK